MHLTHRNARSRWAGAALAACLFQAPAYAQKNVAGAVQTRLSLHKLTVLGSVLLIAAHPDDENAALLAYVARGRGARAAYLSLTRGDGGQNLIGPEKGELLGLIRTQELLAARRIDGGEQYFTRAVDFGFSKSAEETFQKWGHDTILGDVVWVVRNYRPDVIVIGISGGHGHHQAAGILAREVYAAAADRNRYPEQLRYVGPWQAKRLISGGFGGGGRGGAGAAAAGSVRADFGEFNPLLGYSYTEIAGMSRSMHRSQGVGAPERRGPAISNMTVVEGEPTAGDIFGGIDISWRRLPGGAGIAAILEEAERTFQPLEPEKTIPLLVKARPLVAAIRDPWAELKLRELDEAIALCAGLYLDASTDRYAVTPGETLPVNFEATNRSGFPLSLTGVKLEGFAGAPSEEFAPAVLANNQPNRRTLRVTVPQDQPYSQPYWLRKPGGGFVYEVEDQRMVGQAETPPVLTARIRIQAGPETLEFVRPVVRRYVSRTEGETTRPLVVAPPVAVSLADPVVLFPEAKPKPVNVQLRANAAGITGDLSVEVPQGWRAEPASAAFQLGAVGEEWTTSFVVTPPAGQDSGRLRAVARVGGREIASGTLVIEYPDIPPQTIFPPATASLIRTDVRTLARRVGYVMGAGDEVPHALEQMGCEVTLLGPADLARGDLSRFDAIVTGVRAYNVRADLAANHPRLLEYVQRGGTLVVQYNTADGRSSLNWQGFAPYPIQLSGSRVTYEDAPVTFPNPRNGLLRAPNTITEADFQGWVQERGLYFPSQWDQRYETLFESHDPGEGALPGGNLYARFGKGAYIYTAYAWFRQLPAGVPGAYRIFANFLSASRSGP